MNTLFIFNDDPSRLEKAFHGLRLATALSKQDASTVRIFLFADGVRMLDDASNGEFDASELTSALAQLAVPVGACASCLDKRGLANSSLPPNALRASLNDATEWTRWATRVLVY